MLLELLKMTKVCENRFGSNGEPFRHRDGQQLLASAKILERMDRDQKRFLHQESNVKNYLPKNNITPFPGVIIPTLSSYSGLVAMVLDTSFKFLNISGPPLCGKTTFAYKLLEDPIVTEMFRNHIYYTSAYGIPVEVVVANLCRKINYNSLVGGIDINALMNGIMNKGPVMIILDDATLEWQTILEQQFSSTTGCKILVLSDSKFERFEGYDLNNVYDKDGQVLRIHSENPYEDIRDLDDPKNKFAEDGKASPSNLEGFTPPHAQPLLMWGRRRKNSLMGKSVMFDALVKAPKFLPQDGSSSSTSF